MRPIIPHTLVLGLSVSLIGLSVCQVVFSKIIPKVCENLNEPCVGSAFLATGMPPYVPGHNHEYIPMLHLLVIGRYFFHKQPYLDRFRIILCSWGSLIDGFFLQILYIITTTFQNQNFKFKKIIREMRQIVSHTLVRGLSEPLIGLSVWQMVF